VNKRAIELSINFIVIFILAMAMFSVGVTLAYKIFGEAEQMKKNLDDRTRQQIMTMLMEGSSKVIVPIVKKEVEIGGSDVFGLGIRNDLDDLADFYLQIECDAAYEADNTLICDKDTAPCTGICDKWLSHMSFIAVDDFGPIEVSRNERSVEEIFVLIPKDESIKKGTYVFNLQVCAEAECDGSNQYDTLKKLKVVVS